MVTLKSSLSKSDSCSYPQSSGVFKFSCIIFQEVNVFFSSSRALSSNQTSSASEQPAVPELVLSLIRFPEEQKQSIADLSQPWAALVLLPHLR